MGASRPARAAEAAAAELAPAPQLTSKRKRELRAEAHALEPIVQVGHGGLHPPVLAAVRRALRDHGLIKVRLHEPEDKRAMAEALAAETKSALCGLIGHTVILYRTKPVEPRASPAAAPKRSAAARKSPAGARKSARRRSLT